MTFVNIRVALAQPSVKRKARHLKVTIYALYDNADGGVRYVGMTRTALERRLSRHLSTPTNVAMGRWLKRADVRIVALEYVAESEWEEAERGWIHWHRRRGDLLNVDPGGDFRTSTGAARALVLGAFAEPTSTKTAAPGTGRHAKHGPNRFWALAHRPMQRAEPRSANALPSGRRRTRVA